jgi:hypothetical protein
MTEWATFAAVDTPGTSGQQRPRIRACSAAVLP